MQLRHIIHKHGLSLMLLIVFAMSWTTCVSSTPTTTATPSDALLSDDFSTNVGTWTLFDTPEGAAYVQQDELFLEDRGQGIGIYTQLAQRQWDDLVISTRLRQVEGTQDNWMGVICRQQDQDNYYLLAISADGYYLILKTATGVPTALVEPARSDVINPGRATNTLEAQCEGDMLTLRINGEELASVQDDSFETGTVALFADGIAGQRTTVAFDVFAISKP